MMDCSQCPVHPRLKSVFTEYTKKDAEIVRAKGTTPIFFMRQTRAQAEATAKNVLSFAASERAKPFPAVAPVTLQGPDLSTTLWPRATPVRRPEPAKRRRGFDVSGIINRALTAAGWKR